MNAVTILIVEDEPAHAALIERNLKRSGVVNDIVKFENGKLATDYIFSKGDYTDITHDYSLLILLDINMPVKGGVDVLEELKRNDKTKEIPVIMLTTTDDQTEIDTCYELGCNAYVVKPVEHAKFSEAIKNIGLFVNILAVPTNGV
ncbi:MAG: response regulator [Rhodospirillales bacterium]|jgi:CheY-like chemotaxis protein|nr:response regulator [Rhodospirillales bacterium]|tara:strand:+ start:1215 stop:1652 length:438 start_codon:yes stop_codon:yes gene_type:complete